VESTEALSVVQFLASLGILAYASLLDWKTRKVPNVFWIVLAAIAVVLLCVRIMIDEAPLEYLLVLVPIAAVLSDVYLDTEQEGPLAKMAPVLKYGAAVASIVVLAYMWGDDPYFQRLLVVPVLMIVIVLMYMFDVIRGGADAKAFMSLAIMFPFYPSLGDMPFIHAEAALADLVFPFAFVVLFNAAIVVVFLPLAFLLKNLAAGEVAFPQAFVGYRMDASDAKGRFVWLMERMEDDRHVVYTRPRRNEELDAELELLVKAGHDRVWVTPKVPFIIPMTIGLVFSFVVGNLIFLLMGL
jgi:preflagellin peptidase FlaK